MKRFIHWLLRLRRKWVFGASAGLILGLSALPFLVGGLFTQGLFEWAGLFTGEAIAVAAVIWAPLWLGVTLPILTRQMKGEIEAIHRADIEASIAPYLSKPAQ